MNSEQTPEMKKMLEEAQEWLKSLKVELVDGDDVVYKDSWEDFKRKGELFGKENEELN